MDGQKIFIFRSTAKLRRHFDLKLLRENRSPVAMDLEPVSPLRE